MSQNQTHRTWARGSINRGLWGREPRLFTGAWGRRGLRARPHSVLDGFTLTFLHKRGGAKAWTHLHILLSLVSGAPGVWYHRSLRPFFYISTTKTPLRLNYYCLRVRLTTFRTGISRDVSDFDYTIKKYDTHTRTFKWVLLLRFVAYELRAIFDNCLQIGLSNENCF